MAKISTSFHVVHTQMFQLSEAGNGSIGFLGSICIRAYRSPEAFNDVAMGHNPRCPDGFAASPGRKPVTAHGTP